MVAAESLRESEMPTHKYLWSVVGFCLIAGLSACEKPEESLTPPAASPKRISTAKSGDTQAPAKPVQNTSAEAADAELEFPLPVETEGDLELADTSDMTDEQGFEELPVTQPVSLFPPEMLSRSSAHICFFSFNTSAEYIQLKRMINQLNAASAAQISITEYQVLDDDPYDSFVNLLKSGSKCDGVVLSGHHTDEFYGERSDGDLEVEDLEELACDPRYSAWFDNVKALWLQGCNTAKPVFHNQDLKEEERITASPINHMQGLLDVRDMEDSIEDMQDLLLDNTNEENLVNDYMRVFPGATVYGWSNKAPGEQAGAQKSIPYHLAQVTRLVENDEKYFQNPLQTQIPPLAAERYSQVLYGVLKRPNRPGEAFPEKLNEKTFIQAWRDHGNYRYRFAFDNHDIEAFPALANSNNEVLRQLKGLNCLMHQLDDKLDDMDMMQVAEYILRDRQLTSYNSYLLWAMLRSLPEGSVEYTQFRDRLAQDAHLVRELKFVASGNGYSKQDAEHFLAALGPSVPEPAQKQPTLATRETTVEDKEEAETAPDPAPESTAAEQPAEPDARPMKTSTKPTAPQQATDSSAEEPAAPDPGPWYLNEGQGGVTPPKPEDDVYEFKIDSHG